MTTKVTSSLINSVATTQLTGTITNAQLAGSITSDKISSVATTALSGTITNAQLAGSITSDKITSITSSQVTTALGFTPGTVTSVATGNGLSGGTITATGTLAIACPTWGSIGSYATGIGTTYGYYLNGNWNNPTLLDVNTNYSAANAGISGGSGTWKCMGISGSYYQYYSYSRGCCVSADTNIGISRYIYLFCRVS